MGRDGYVFANNSGLRSDPDMWGSSGRKPGWDSNVKKESHNKIYDLIRNHAPSYHHKPTSVVQYLADGTGRDGYVIKNHGGTCKEYKIGHVKYEQEYLRASNKYPANTPVMDYKL